MPLYTYPTAAETREDLGLRTEQINNLYSDADALTDIGQKITEQANLVESRVRKAARPYAFPLTDAQMAIGLPSYLEAERTAWQVGRQTALALATKYFVLAAIYRRSGSFNEVYTAKAAEYQALGEMILSGDPDDPNDTGLLGELADIVSLAGADTESDGLSILTIAVGENFTVDEDASV